jgi:hypothetical protein
VRAARLFDPSLKATVPVLRNHLDVFSLLLEALSGQDAKHSREDTAPLECVQRHAFQHRHGVASEWISGSEQL